MNTINRREWEKCDLIFTRGASLNIAQIGSFTTEIVRNLAEAFSHSFEDIQRLLNMPLALASQGTIVGRLWNRGFVNHLVQMAPPERRAEVEELRDREMLNIEEARELVHKIANDPLHVLPNIPGSDGGALDFIAEDAGAQTNFRLLLSVAISAGWTAFEAMTTDLWIAVVNSRPKVLVDRLFAVLREHEKPTGVSLKKLSRYGFDISQRLGTALFSRFDFTKLAGMTTAFEALFGKNKATNFKTEEIKQLAAYRNVIVHRGGRADAAFIAMTGIRIQDGSAIDLSGAETIKMLNAAIVKGTSLLHLTDDWLQQNP